MASGHETNAEFLASEVQVQIIVRGRISQRLFHVLEAEKDLSRQELRDVGVCLELDMESGGLPLVVLSVAPAI